MRLSSAASICVIVLVLGCEGGSDTVRASLGDVDPFGGYWAIRAECTGSDLQVEFRPGERLSVAGLGYATDEEIAVECGDPERVPVSNQELRRRAATPTAADLAAPTFEPTKLSCSADGSLVVWAHPVWAQNAIVGGALRVERGGHTIVTGAILPEDSSNLASQLRWWRTVCKRA